MTQPLGALTSSASLQAFMSFDPRTQTMQSWPLPAKGSVVRHMVTAPDGTLWLAHSGVAKLIRVQVASAK
jgi:streptogramin lyase